MIHDGWCPDCDERSALIDSGDADGTGTAWASCTECGIGWVWRDEVPEAAAQYSARDEAPMAHEDRRAA